MSYFNFIDDNDLFEVVEQVVSKAKAATQRTEDEMEKNTLDPFAAVFTMAYNELSLEDWNELEKERQAQKSIQNAIGEFHQNLLGKFHGWENPGRGGSVDLINQDLRIIAEVKNKYNTMNSSSAAETYMKLANHLRYDRKGYTAYLVQIVPKNPADYDVAWSPNLTTTALREDIRRIDGESFYDLASGEKDTLLRLYGILPEVIAQITQKSALDRQQIEACVTLFKTVYK